MGRTFWLVLAGFLLVALAAVLVPLRPGILRELVESYVTTTTRS
jgi:hypothetical protein